MDYIISMLPMLLKGTVTSLKLFAFALVLSIPLGLPVALQLRSRFRPLRWIANIYVYIFRSTPLMLQLVIIYFGLPRIPGIGPYLLLDRFHAAILAFVLNYIAYFAEIYRSGLLGVNRSQFEACQVLGLSHWQTQTRVIFPQMFRICLPSVANEVITLLKDTSLLYAVSVAELIHNAEAIVNRDANMTALMVALVIYMILNFFLTVILKHLESRFSWGKNL
ncbi:amino acid ABC transporter permease [Oscillospiraceae bacterium HV4-5-C5C]|nr:amino acid ABC transporter permease [Oscillospiraceae bacterium HV4-5-C5C]